MEEVILVDENDSEIGREEKLEAHRLGKLHRAFSVFIFNSKGELMLQRRALAKYHSGGLWTNTCCSHPRLGEETIDAAHRRLVEEMGFDCQLEEKFSFMYQAPMDNGLTENEFDHILVGRYDLDPVINREEVEEWKWELPEIVLSDIREKPEMFTFWFKSVFEEVISRMKQAKETL